MDNHLKAYITNLQETKGFEYRSASRGISLCTFCLKSSDEGHDENCGNKELLNLLAIPQAEIVRLKSWLHRIASYDPCKLNEEGNVLRTWAIRAMTGEEVRE